VWSEWLKDNMFVEIVVDSRLKENVESVNQQIYQPVGKGLQL
jgi:hypothetical protein